MTVAAIIGAQWGDEGKGKMVDMLAERAKYVVRFSGGDNAGHTVVNPQGEFALQLVPSGIFYPGTTCVIGNGVVVNPATLLRELNTLKSRGIDTSRLYISDRAHLIMPYHMLIEKFEEEALGDKAIGTTLKGIGPTYADKVSRIGLRAGDLLDMAYFKERLAQALNNKNQVITRIYGKPPVSLEEIFNQYSEYAKVLAPRIRDTSIMLADAIQRGEHVLLEGAQGVLLDPDFGTYPFNTSSSPMAGGACLGAGISPNKLNHILGVFKAFQTRVGAGPMPTQLNDETGKLIQERGHEFGTVSGRPRSCGWFDGVAARLSARVNGYSSIIITRLDILDVLPSLKVCTAYKLDGKTIDYFPASASALEKCQPVYEELPGWEKPTSGARQFKDLPRNARRYIKKLEEITGCPASLISIGKRREETVVRKTIFS